MYDTNTADYISGYVAGDNRRRNRIPRHYLRITAQALIRTTACRPGDIIHIYRNDAGHIGFNTVTKAYAYYPASLLRNPAAFQFLEVMI